MITSSNSAPSSAKRWRSLSSSQHLRDRNKLESLAFVSPNQFISRFERVHAVSAHGLVPAIVQQNYFAAFRSDLPRRVLQHALSCGCVPVIAGHAPENWLKAE